LAYISIHRPIARHTDACIFMYIDWDDAAMRMYMRGAIFHEHGDVFLFLNIYIYIYIHIRMYIVRDVVMYIMIYIYIHSHMHVRARRAR